MNKKRIVYFDYIRILSALLIILTHISAQIITDYPVHSVNFIVTSSYDSLGFFGVALFVMLSGALFLNEEYDTSIHRLIFKKILHIIFLYYTWKFLYQILTFTQNKIPFTYENMKEMLVYVFSLGRGCYHLWYLPMIAMIYLCVPIIKKSLQSKTVCLYFIVIFFIAFCFMPFILHYDFPFKNTITGTFCTYDFSFFGSYLGYFVLGHYLANLQPVRDKKTRIIIYCVGLYSIFLLLFSNFLDSSKANTLSSEICTPFTPMSFFLAVSGFVFFRSFCDKHKNADNKLINTLANGTLGVYLFHPSIIALYSVLGLSPGDFSPILSIPVYTITTFLLGSFITYLLLKIPIFRKLVS